MVGVGSTVGNYEVLAKIGEGAMGAVWLARHPQIGKRVALKVIRPELTNDEEVLTRFFNEARAVTLIGHPNIVDVQDFGQTPDGDSFIVMELLEGQTLAQALSAGEMTLPRIVAIATQLTDGLQAAHVRGIIHRDLKPDNVFVTTRSDGREHVKILDFGLAKLSGPGAIQHKTRTGTVLGTAHYMPPEAAEGSRHVDHRGDIYALGCILYELATRSVPFPGEGFGEVLVRHLRDAPDPPSRLRAELPPWLDKLVLHALAKKAEHRFQSMEAFGAALRDPHGWDVGVSTEEVAQHTRIQPAPRPTPTPAATPVVRATPSQQAPTVISPQPATRPGEPVRVPARGGELLPAILFAIAILAVAGAIVARMQHRPALEPPLVTAPAVVAPAPVVVPPLSPRPEIAPAEEPDDMTLVKPVLQPTPARPPVKRPAPKPAAPKPAAPKPGTFQQDGSLLAPSW